MQSNTSVLHDGFTVIFSFHFNLMIILEAVFLSAYNIVIFLRGQKLFLATFIHACVCVCGVRMQVNGERWSVADISASCLQVI